MFFVKNNGQTFCDISNKKYVMTVLAVLFDDSSLRYVIPLVAEYLPW